MAHNIRTADAALAYLEEAATRNNPRTVVALAAEFVSNAEARLAEARNKHAAALAAVQVAEDATRGTGYNSPERRRLATARGTATRAADLVHTRDDELRDLRAAHAAAVARTPEAEAAAEAARAARELEVASTPLPAAPAPAAAALVSCDDRSRVAVLAFSRPGGLLVVEARPGYDDAPVTCRAWAHTTARADDEVTLEEHAAAAAAWLGHFIVTATPEEAAEADRAARAAAYERRGCRWAHRDEELVALALRAAHLAALVAERAEAEAAAALAAEVAAEHAAHDAAVELEARRVAALAEFNAEPEGADDDEVSDAARTLLELGLPRTAGSEPTEPTDPALAEARTALAEAAAAYELQSTPERCAERLAARVTLEAAERADRYGDDARAARETTCRLEGQLRHARRAWLRATAEAWVAERNADARGRRDWPALVSREAAEALADLVADRDGTRPTDWELADWVSAYADDVPAYNAEVLQAWDGNDPEGVTLADCGGIWEAMRYRVREQRLEELAGLEELVAEFYDWHEGDLADEPTDE